MRLEDATSRGIDVSPAGDWLLDNYHVVREHILEVDQSVPRGYYRELPELAEGPLAKYPRVYQVAITLIAHTEGRIDLANTELFVREFQRVAPLAIGELWAIPAMLRLGLLENVRRMSLRTVERLDELERADRWAKRLQAAGGLESASVRDLIGASPPITPLFLTRLLRLLRQGAISPLVWLEQWLTQGGVDLEAAAARSSERLALTQMVMANSIISLRAIGSMDWREFVERQSQLEAMLAADPAGAFSGMTFATRDRYRHVVEHLARKTTRTELDVARLAIDLAFAGLREGPNGAHRTHVGFYLVDDGLLELERAIGYRPPVMARIRRWLSHHQPLLIAAVAVATFLAVVLLLWLAGPEARRHAPLVILFGLLPAAEIAVNGVNRLVTMLLPPRILPKLELRERPIPVELRTAVVVPTLFDTVEGVRESLEHLEVQYLANRQERLHFAVLSDFTDAATEITAGDAEILAAAIAGVRDLNARYSGGADDAFYLFHRSRLWNPAQQVWMGWERKRGKLAQFNRFLRGEADGAFSTIVGDVSAIRQVRYVITLDSDTVLPPDAADLLIGTIAHPLNRAVYDHDHGRVLRGYGILQPRIGVALSTAHRSRFASIHSGHPGVDPYTTAVSDVYQDLFAEGSFTGKGIYDVDVFELATEGRFPENTLLSHDLIEGSYARAGLATDIELFDDYPTRYLSYTSRKHRWIRGDWQLIQWLLPRVRGPNGKELNTLSVLSRWKLFDNLRRSTSEISQLLLFLAGWSLLPGSPLRWTLLGLGAVATPWIMALVPALLRPPLDKSWLAYYAAVRQDAATSAKQLGLALILLPHQAWVSADAIGRTLWRLFVSKQNLLEWRTASQTERALAPEARETWRAMGPSVTLAVVLAILIVLPHVGRPGAWPWLVAILPIATLWLASPVIAHALTQPALEREHRLKGDQRPAALRYALPHWRYFDRFVTAETNWLVPDNFQEDPLPVVAMRTSPTNIGLQLLATVSAYDLGFITLDGMTTRLEAAFGSLEKMRRFRGHFLNWYDLHDLEVLHPSYVSTVDSGNLAGHLLALRQACLTIPDEPAVDSRVWHALEVGLEIAEEQLHALESSRARLAPRHRQAVHDAARAVRAGRRLVTLARKGRHPPSLRDIAKQLVTARSGLPSDGGAGLTIARDSILWVVDRIAAHQHEWDAGTAVPTLRALATHAPASIDHVARLEAIAERAYEYVMGMDFTFLFDRDRKLFTVGYQEATHTRDNSFYDLLASETRLASFVAIAKKDVPVEHWFRLGRSLTHAASETALISWSGSMFEYLMPLLVMHSMPETLLDQTYHGVVERHMSYCAERGLPWGISESAYNLRDRAQTYQYRAFGVPDLALKRGLRRDLVVAPYASALAVMVQPENALENLDRLARLGALGAYGFHDAVDYTRPTPGHSFAIVYTYMAHHIGMTLVALTNALSGHAWQRRFHSDPLVQSAELLLHERIPRRLVLQPTQRVRPEPLPADLDLERPAVREIETPDTPRPRIALLGHLPYTIMVSNAGAGYSRYENLAITRWRADATTDHTGLFCYVKDLATNRVWSAAHQPVRAPADWYRALLATDRVVFHRRDGDIETHTEIAAVPADAAEVRRITLTNHGDEPREIELTSYGEIVLAPPDDDRAHRAFGNLFIETEWHEWCTAITATRRPRSATEARLWCVHLVDTSPDQVGPVSYETDRAGFLGRGRGADHPIALTRDNDLNGTAGAVLDPIFALRIRLRVPPGRTASAAFTTLVAASRERAFELADRYHDSYAAERALELAWTAAQLELRELGITPADAALYQELAGNLFYADPSLRASREEVLENHGGQPLLWSQGISGDWPILLATIDDLSGLPTWRELLAAHQYWRRRGMLIDLILVFEGEEGYFQELQEQITNAVLSSSEAGVLDHPGGVFIRRSGKLNEEERRMLRATARVLVPCDGRPLARIVGPPDSLVELEEWEPRTLTVAPRRPRPPRWGPVATLPVAPVPATRAGAAASNGSDGTGDRPDAPPNGFGALADDG
ncbi:MAG: glucoamylase family protein, partial [Gemmatimonadota bacterium]